MKSLPMTAALALLLAVPRAGAEEKPANAGGFSSSSSSSSSHTDGSGNTVTVTTTEHNGKRETRRTVTGPNGKIISDAKESGDPRNAAEEEKPAAKGAKAGGPWLGVHTAEVPAALREQLDLRDGEGLLVEQLSPDSPARSAGIGQHDIILSFNLTPVSTPDQLRKELSNRQPGEKILIEYLHKAQRQKVAVTLGRRAENEQPGPQAKDAAQATKADHHKPKAPEAVANANLPGLPAIPNLPGLNGNTVSSTTVSSFSRTVVIGADGKTSVIENDNGGDTIEQMLRDPNVSETIKDSLRKIQEQIRDFRKRDGDTPKPRADSQ